MLPAMARTRTFWPEPSSTRTSSIRSSISSSWLHTRPSKASPSQPNTAFSSTSRRFPLTTCRRSLTVSSIQPNLQNKIYQTSNSQIFATCSLAATARSLTRLQLTTLIWSLLEASSTRSALTWTWET